MRSRIKPFFLVEKFFKTKMITAIFGKHTICSLIFSTFNNCSNGEAKKNVFSAEDIYPEVLSQRKFRAKRQILRDTLILETLLRLNKNVNRHFCSWIHSWNAIHQQKCDFRIPKSSRLALGPHTMRARGTVAFSSVAIARCVRNEFSLFFNFRPSSIVSNYLAFFCVCMPPLCGAIEVMFKH